MTVDLTPQSGYDKVGAVTILVAGRRGLLSLPGEQTAPAARTRVKPRQSGAETVVNDLGHAIRVVVSSKEGLTPGPLLDFDFDVCSGAPAAQASDLSCRIESCASGGARLRQCACSISLH